MQIYKNESEKEVQNLSCGEETITKECNVVANSQAPQEEKFKEKANVKFNNGSGTLRLRLYPANSSLTCKNESLSSKRKHI